MSQRHLTDEQIALLVDGRLERAVAEYARLHLAACEACRRSHQAVTRFEGFARTLPAEQADRELADRVMAALPRRMYNPASLHLLGLVAPVLGVLFVLATISIAWTWYGGMASSGDAGSRWFSMLSHGYEQAEGTVGAFAQLATDSMTRFAPFLRDRYAVTISFLSLAAVVFLATFDRFVQRKLEGRS